MIRYDLSLGDVTPVQYGGFLVNSKTGDAIRWDEPEFDVEEHQKRGIECSRFVIEADVMKELDWVKREDIASSFGRSIEEINKESVSEDINDRARLYEEVGNYYGWLNIDSYPEKYTAAELALKYPGVEPFPLGSTVTAMGWTGEWIVEEIQIEDENGETRQRQYHLRSLEKEAALSGYYGTYERVGSDDGFTRIWADGGHLTLIASSEEDLADDDRFKCDGCGDIHDNDDSIRCPECGGLFCDNCYDTNKGDGCHCHPSANG